MELNKALKLLEQGFSLLCVGDNKQPNHKWKDYQKKAATAKEFEKLYKNPTTTAVGIITGYNDIEVIDVDLKVFESYRAGQEFWQEFYMYLYDNVPDFYTKCAVYKTKNDGYHIIYKCKQIEGNLKLAKLEGMDQAVIETRGIGGYIYTYDNLINNTDYLKVDYINPEEREIIFEIAKSYNHIPPQPEKEQKKYQEQEIKCWDDYNAKVNIFDIVNDDFEITRNLKDKYIIKRYGVDSPHSGYIYKDSGCMYLFSTGTIYPHEQLISPYAAYTYKYHNGSFSQSAKQIYIDGYGSRIVKEIILPDKIEIKQDDLIFPIDIFPLELQNYIIQCNKTLDSSIDYMGCSLLWMFSVIIGNTRIIEVKKGWKEIASLWLAIVGKAGIGKTPSIHNIIFPLMQSNNKEIKKYIDQYDRWLEYDRLDKKEKDKTIEVKKPLKSQFIVNDVTVEALVDLHQDNKNVVALFKDELAGWFKDMNKYRAGSDLEFWLSTWSGKAVNINRKTAKNSFVDKPFIPVLGGIQPSILQSFYTEETKDNGFVDRMLLSFPELQVESYNEEEMQEELLEWYENKIIKIYDHIQMYDLKMDEKNEITPIVCTWSLEAKDKWIEIFNKITLMQNSDTENEYMKSMLPKQKAYIPRFALIIHYISSQFDDSLIDTIIDIESIEKAEKLSSYFIAMAKKIKVNAEDIKEIRKAAETAKNPYEAFCLIVKNNPDFNKNQVAEQLGVSRQTIYNYSRKLEKKV